MEKQKTPIHIQRSASRLGAQDKRLGILLVMPVVVVMMILILYPLANLFYASFHKTNALTKASMYVGFQNFISILGNTSFWDSLWKTIVYTICSLVPSTVLGTLFAVVLNQKMVCRSVIRAFVIFPYLVPMVVAAAIFRFMLNDLIGIINHWLLTMKLITVPINVFGDTKWAMFGVVLVTVWKYTPMMMIAVLGKLQTIPGHLYEAARIDGSNAWTSFWHITMPYISSVLSVVMLMRSIWLFNKWDVIFLLTGGGPLNATGTLPMMLYNEAFSSYNLGRASAIGVVMFLMLILLSRVYYFSYQKTQERF